MAREIADFAEWVDKLHASTELILVEGKKDIRALAALGIDNAVCLNEPLYCVVEKVACLHDSVIILTDLDKEGKKLYVVLKKDLAKHGVKVDDRFRNFLFRNSTLCHIEGICTYIRNTQYPK
jgi:5S rRNA maturation endonuclease (ribonuclease M5)